MLKSYKFTITAVTLKKKDLLKSYTYTAHIHALIIYLSIYTTHSCYSFAFLQKDFPFIHSQVKADKELWEHKANKILQRDEPQQEDNSNPDETDLPEGAGKVGGVLVGAAVDAEKSKT